MKPSLAWQKTSSHLPYQIAHIHAQAEVLRKHADTIKLLKSIPRRVSSTKKNSKKREPEQLTR